MNYTIRVIVEEVDDDDKVLNKPGEWSSDYAVTSLGEAITIGQKIRILVNKHLSNSRFSVPGWRSHD